VRPTSRSPRNLVPNAALDDRHVCFSMRCATRRFVQRLELSADTDLRRAETTPPTADPRYFRSSRRIDAIVGSAWGRNSSAQLTVSSGSVFTRRSDREQDRVLVKRMLAFDRAKAL